MVSKKIKPSITEIAPLIIDALDRNKEVRLTVTGESMYPIFKGDTDCVVIRKSDNYKKYDIVLYKRPDGSYVLHRMVSDKKSVFVFAGDNETKKEYGIDIGACLAKVTRFEKNGKTFSVDKWWYILYTRIWVQFFPFRIPLAKLLKVSSKILHKIIF